jgi:hypothetical protein
MAREPDYILILNKLDVIGVHPKTQILGLTLSALSLQLSGKGLQIIQLADSAMAGLNVESSIHKRLIYRWT